MSELQWSLIAVGTVVVLGVFAYNKWQERRHRKVAEQVFAHEHEDVLLAGQPAAPQADAVRTESAALADPVIDADFRQEPVWVDPTLTSERQEPALLDLPDPELEVIEQDIPVRADEVVLPVVVDASAHPVPQSLLNPLCDASILLELVSGLKASQILPLGQEAFNRSGVPVYWLGLSENGVWQALAADMHGHFRHVRLVVQLATRKGPIQEPAVNLLVNTVEQVAVDLNAVLDVSEMEQALRRGRQIDQFCADVDLQIGLNLVGSTPFLGTKIRALAEAAGMALNWQGRFEMRDEHDQPLFTLSNQEVSPFSTDTLKTLRTHGITFLLDVPRVANGGQVFDHMLRLARQFADALQAHLVDDNRQPLNDTQLEGIRAQFVVQPQNDMAAKGIPAGSPLALRLFS